MSPHVASFLKRRAAYGPKGRWCLRTRATRRQEPTSFTIIIERAQLQYDGILPATLKVDERTSLPVPGARSAETDSPTRSERRSALAASSSRLSGRGASRVEEGAGQLGRMERLSKTCRSTSDERAAHFGFRMSMSPGACAPDASANDSERGRPPPWDSGPSSRRA